MSKIKWVRSACVWAVFSISVTCLAPSVTRGQSKSSDSSDPALRDYLSGNGLLNRGLYDLAAGEYKSFLAEHPDHDRAPIAQYGLGVCQFRLGKYEETVATLSKLADRSNFQFEAEVETMLGQSLLALKRYEPAAEAFEKCARDHAKHDLADEAASGATEALYLAGKYDKSAGWARMFASHWPDSPLRSRAAFFGGLAEMARKGYGEAAAFFEDVLQRDAGGPFADQSALLLAQCHERDHKIIEAIRQYQKLLQRKKTRFAPEALFALGALHHQRGELKEAGIALDALLDGFGKSKVVPEASLLRGRVAFEQGKYDDAYGFFKKAGNADPALSDRAAYWMAKCDLRRKRYDKAESRLTEAVKKYDDSELIPEMWYDLAVVRLKQESLDGAIKALTTFRSRFPDHELSSDALRLLAMTEHQREHYDKSLAYCDEYLKTYGDHDAAAEVAFLAAENEFLSGRYEKAADRYRQYLSDHKGDERTAKAKFRLGTALHRLGRFDEAAPLLAEASASSDGTAAFATSDLELGDIYFRRGEWKQAEQRLQAFVDAGSNQPGMDDALIKLGLSLQRQDRPEDAVRVYDRLLKEHADSPHRLQAMFEKGQSLVMLKRNDEAEKMFRAVLKEGKDSRFAAHALNHLAALAMRKGKYDEADALFGQAAGSASDDNLKATAAYEQINALMAAKKFAEAEAAIRSFLSDYGSNEKAPAAKAQLAIALSRQNKYEKAVAAADEALGASDGVDPSLLAGVRYEKAWSLRSLGRTDEAAAAYHALLDKGATHEYELHALLELAGIESETKHYDKAIELLKRIRSANDVPADLMGQATYRMGVCAFELGRYDEAASLFEEYITGDPTSEYVASAAYYAGEAAFKLGQFERAVKHFERLTNDYPSNDVAAPGLLRLGESLAQLQRFSASEKVFANYLKGHGDADHWYQAQFGLGWARENQKRYGEAVDAYKKVIDRHQGPTAARAQFQIGECLFAQGKYDEAARELLKVDILYAYPEWSAAALFEAGRCFTKLNKTAEARKQFTQVVKAHKDSKWASMAEQQLTALTSASEVPGH